jgi:hypothetical protein
MLADAEPSCCLPGAEVVPSVERYKKTLETATELVSGLPCTPGSLQTAAAAVLARREWQEKPEEAALQN